MLKAVKNVDSAVGQAVNSIATTEVSIDDLLEGVEYMLTSKEDIRVESDGEAKQYVFVKIDGREFVYGKDEKETKTLEIVIDRAKLFYYNHKGDPKEILEPTDGYSPRAKIFWVEDEKDHCLSMSKTSRMRLERYYLMLQNKELKMNDVRTVVRINRAKNNKGESWSHTQFEAFNLETGESLGVYAK